MVQNSNVFQIEYLKNAHSQKWLPRRNTNLGEVVMLANNKVAWCDYHSRWEHFIQTRDDIINFECGRKMLCPTVLQNEKKLTSVLFTVDKEKLLLTVSFRFYSTDFAHAKKIVKKSSETSNFCLKNGTIQIEHINQNKIEFDEDLLVDEIPTEILDSIQYILSNLSKKIYGIECKNNYNLCQNGFKHFVKFPSCPPFANLTPSFRRVANNFRGSLHIFEDFCDFFQIAPSKKFRKMFFDNSDVMLIYLFLNKIGFKDSNVYYKYYDNVLVGTLVRQRLYCKNEDYNVLTGFPFAEMAFWLEKSLEKVSETVSAKRLLEPLVNGQNDISFQIDAMQMYYQNYHNLPNLVKNRVLKEGFTDDIHDRICEALNVRPRHHFNLFGDDISSEIKEIQYTEDELELEGEYKNLVFELPKTTDDLYTISDKMRNCVGFLYRERVLSKSCLIVTAADKKTRKKVACIEIVRWEVTQALASSNRRIDIEYVPQIQYWMKKNELKNSVSDLSQERVLRG